MEEQTAINRELVNSSPDSGWKSSLSAWWLKAARLNCGSAEVLLIACRLRSQLPAWASEDKSPKPLMKWQQWLPSKEFRLFRLFIAVGKRFLSANKRPWGPIKCERGVKKKHFINNKLFNTPCVENKKNGKNWFSQLKKKKKKKKSDRVTPRPAISP